MPHTFDLSTLSIPESADLCFVHVCDCHVTDAESARIVAAGAEAINRVSPEFVVFGGDIANEGKPEAYDAISEAISGLWAPAYCVVGNHDMANEKRNFSDHFGAVNHAFEAGPYHCICLDSCGPTQLTYGGLFTGATIAWLEEHLRSVPASKPVILFTHHGIHSEQPHAPLQNLLWDVLNYKPIHAALAPQNLILACAGHAHMNALQRWGSTTMLWSGVLSTVRANHVALPPGFRVVWLEGEKVGTEWVAAVPL